MTAPARGTGDFYMDKTMTTPMPIDRLHQKAAQYGWKVHDLPGVFMMIPKSDLNVDHSYQRNTIRRDRITTIARAFRWSEFGTLSVVLRQNGSFHVTDGQHRLAAANLIPTIKEVPCIVFESNDLKEEARAFLGINRLRTPVGSVDKYYASKVAGDEVSAYIGDLCMRNGIEISNSNTNGSIRCLAVLTKLAKDDRTKLEIVMPHVVAFCEGQVIHERILDGIFYLYATHGDRVFKQPIIGRLVALGRDGILKAAQDAAAYYSGGGAKIWAQGITKAINKGLRTNRLDENASRADRTTD